MKEPCDLTATEAIARMSRGELNRETLVHSCAERIAAREPAVQAWQHLGIDAALEAAVAADRDRGNSVLHGVPFGAKDIIETSDMPTEYGSRIYPGNRTAWDATCVALTRAAGGILLGKTVTTEFAHQPGGKTRNPHDPARTPGGSSSGSAAAVAAGMVPLAIGTQTGGSTIRPAAYCGVVGYKPSYGDMGLFGVREHAQSFDTLGLFARSVDDIGLFRAVLVQDQPQSLPQISGSELRIGFCRTLSWAEAEESTRNLLEDAARRLSRTGATVRDVKLPEKFEREREAARLVGGFEFVRNLSFELRHHRDKLSQALLDGRVADGLKCDFERYVQAREFLADCRRQLAAVFEDHDMLLTPSATGEAPEGHLSTGNPIFNSLWTELHVPALTIPAFTGPRGLPIGAQLIGKYSSDRSLLGAARWIAAHIS